LGNTNPDWREKTPLLFKYVIADLAKYGFQVFNEIDYLCATKALKRQNPPNCKLIFLFPSEYPLKDIQVFIQSEQLFIEYLKKPIKHLFMSNNSHELEHSYGQGILELCLRGAWNSEDYTRIKNVYSQSLNWFRDYNLGESFPEDFNLPEGTLFFPLKHDVTFYVPEFFVAKERTYFSSNTYGTFAMEYSDFDKKGILSGLTKFTVEDTFVSESKHESYNIKPLANNIFNNHNLIIINGIWFYTDIPPSIIAHDRHIYSVPFEKIKFLYRYLKKNSLRMSLGCATNL